MTIRVLVADEHLLPLDAIAEVLASVKDFEVVGAVSRSSMIVPVAVRRRPDVAVLGMGPAQGGFRLVRELGRRLPDCRVVIMTARPTRTLVDRAVSAGARGVVTKQTKIPCLVDAIRDAAVGRPAGSRPVAGRPAAGDTPEAPVRPAAPTAVAEQILSEREREILRLTATGASVKEVARELYLAAGTVRNLTSGAMRKLDGRNRFDAARIASERGLL
ncbi:LuxR C-terminal-related transcriptional regulator [Kitasatospora sp. NPDC015120]|uniref:LuxR C-terminal-related transcriptional regulator n=1 Tax=Kitasatospora sp. NPDC015120 TaxID=3364023 RepID=UPI0036F4758F